MEVYMRKAQIAAIDYYLPEKVVDNEELSKLFPEWSPKKIFEKTGIRKRHIAAENETAADLAVKAAEKLIKEGKFSADEIDMVIFCTQSPDYPLPTSACLIQERLGIPQSAGAFDFNLGCSGFVYGLSLVKGLIETGSAKNVLLMNGNTYSKHMHPMDKNVRTIFGDAGTATLIKAVDINQADIEFIGPFVYGTDGAGAESLIVKAGGARHPSIEKAEIENGNDSKGGFSPNYLFMDGPSIFSFTLKVVPKMIKSLLEKTGFSKDDIDMFVFHQANKFMLDYLRRQSKIDPEKFIIDLEDIGNTVSCTIPIALARSGLKRLLKPSMRIATVSFGVGLSWAAGLVKVSWV